jgi:membrane associated rhomboid family serine protease
MGLGDRDYMRSGQPAGIGWGNRGRKSRGRWSILTILIAINIGVFIIQYVFGLWGEEVQDGGYQQFIPSGGASAELVFTRGHVWTLFTYMFVHGNLLHIAALIPEQQVSLLLFFVIPLRLRLKNLAYSLTALAAVFLVIDLLVSADIWMVSGVGHAAHLGGALAGWLYVRMSGFGGRGMAATYSRRRGKRIAGKTERKRSSQMGKIVSTAVEREIDGVVFETDEFTMNRINTLLEKISEEGMGNLTEEERKVLQRYSKKISGRID